MSQVNIYTESNYLTACARIRNITKAELMRRLIVVIDRDQLVAAVLDDDAKRTHTRYQHRFHMRGETAP